MVVKLVCLAVALGVCLGSPLLQDSFSIAGDERHPVLHLLENPAISTEVMQGEPQDSDATAAPLLVLADKDPTVDFVYTWYNALDPKAQELRLRTLDQFKGDPDICKDAFFKGRYFDNGEFKYSLRSVHKFAGWVNKIYVVMADNQPPPAWLNTGNHRIHIVRHSEIFPDKDVLPTFNSLAIEANLHRIPGLSNFFVYLNDDMMFGDYISKTDFFEWGRPRIWVNYWWGVSGQVTMEDGGHEAAEKNTNNVIRSHTRKMPTRDENLYGRSLMHFAKALSRKMMGHSEDLNWYEYKKVRRAQFRLRTTFSPILFGSMMCLHEKNCEDSTIPSNLLVNMNEHNDPAGMFKRLRVEKYKLLCFNNGDESHRNDMVAGLNSLYPEKSEFEK